MSSGQVYDRGFGNVNHRATLIELTTTALQVQQMWTSLESVFTGGDIAKAMPMEEGCCNSPEPGCLSTNGRVPAVLRGPTEPDPQT